MLQTFKILRGFDRVNSDTWFQRVDTTGRVARSAADPLHLRQATRLEIRRQFFSKRVIEELNEVPSVIQNARTVYSFKRAYKAHRMKTVGLA
jgi:hypothetical protein